MRYRHFKRATLVDLPIEAVFEFFSNAANLESLTPPWLGFEILSPQPLSMAEGTLIDYRIKLRGVPLRWQSEITAWEPPTRFVDEQRRGPYRAWIHEHRFIEREEGTEIVDNVAYAVFGGALIDRLFVRRDIDKIFDFRLERQRELLAPFASGETGSSKEPIETKEFEPVHSTESTRIL